MAKATRAAFGETLIKLVDEGMDIMAVDAISAAPRRLLSSGRPIPTASLTWASPSRT